jgi:[acyl-carrier-protein] S-malonyltransferase
MKIIFLFPGYGSQSVGMGKSLYDEYRVVQEYFEEAANCLGHNFVKLCFAASDVELGRIEYAYPSIFLVSCAIAQVLIQKGIKPDCVAGYNIGEYAAIHTARGFTFPDGLYLLSKYATFYQEAYPHSSVSGLRITGLPYDLIRALCTKSSVEDQEVLVASQDQRQVYVVMGHTAAVDRFRSLASDQQGAVIEEMPMEFGLHSRLMESVIAQYKMYMEKVDFKDLEVPLYANVDARSVTLGSQVKEGVIAQVTHVIRWNDILANLAEYDLVVQVGPGTALQKMVKALYPDKLCVAVNTKSDVEALKQIVNPSLQESEEHNDGDI